MSHFGIRFLKIFQCQFSPKYFFPGKKNLLTSTASRKEDRMAEKQPMLSFAKVVSGQAEDASSPSQQVQHTQDSSHSSTQNENSQPEKQAHPPHNRREKENVGGRSERPRGEGKGKRRNNRKGDRKPRGETKTEKPAEKVATEEVKPVEIPVVLEPAPLPAINAWFKNKGAIFLKLYIHKPNWLCLF